LAFHTVAFGGDIGGGRFLRRMTEIATDIYDSAPPDPLVPAGENPCSFTEAANTVCRIFTSDHVADRRIGRTGQDVFVHSRVVEQPQSSFEATVRVALGKILGLFLF
jgi:hypothetical protein